MILLPKTHSPRAGLVAGAVAAACLGGALAAPTADALVVSSGPEGLQMREPNNTLDRVHVSLVEAGGLKYRVEMAQFGGRGIQFGLGCRQVSDRQGVDIALCERTNPVVSQVSLGPFDDRFTVDPSFPDPITVQDGGIGADVFALGAGDDTGTARDGDQIIGNGGRDQLASLGGRVDGGEGDDTLTAFSSTIGGLLIGGPGTDTFDAQGGQAVIDSRDGIPESVRCGAPGPRRIGSTALVDLVDTPGDAELVAGGCRAVDRAPKAERTAAQLASPKVALRRGTARVKVRCTTSAACAGTVTLSSGARTDSARFSVDGHRTATIKLAARTGSATIRLAEQGREGPRTVRATVRVG